MMDSTIGWRLLVIVSRFCWPPLCRLVDVGVWPGSTGEGRGVDSMPPTVLTAGLSRDRQDWLPAFVPAAYSVV